MGTVWLLRVLRAVTRHYGLRFAQTNNQRIPDTKVDVLFASHGDVPTETLIEFRGSHMVRDLRDVVVSRYFYHLWTEEPWAHALREEHGNQSYQERLQGLTQEEGLHLEIDSLALYVDRRKMRKWKYDDTRFFEIRYEQMIADEQSHFQRMFEHYGFHQGAIEKCVSLAEAFTFRKITGRQLGETSERSHLRSGRAGQWRELFDREHKQHFKNSLGDLLVRMGYEKNGNW
jgi:hypothetical protein